MRWADAALERARQAERERLDPHGEAARREGERASLAEARRTLGERLMSPDDERRRAEIKAMVEREIARRQAR